VPIERLTPEQRESAWRVFARYYEDTDRGRFDRDLDGKQHIFLLEADGQLVGFSTVTVERVGPIVSIFSGDTVLETDHRGAGALQWAFFRYIVRTKLRHPHRLVTWFLISKGYKTYLLLARNFPTHWPRRDAPTPPWARDLLIALARRRFGDALDDERLILRFEHDHERLKPDVAPVDDGETDPDIRFFVQANPGHAEGDELCCLGVVDARLALSWPLKRLRKLRDTGR
jgi:hypothetical protein